MAYPVKGIDMPKPSAFTNLAAECGHTYKGYANSKLPAMRYCVDCLRFERHRMRRDNLARLAALTTSERPSFYISKADRLAIYERDEWTCQLCLEPAPPTTDHLGPWSLTLDHIVCQSWTDEPDHSPSNLRLAHRWCNSVRGNESTWTVADLRAA